MSTGDGHLYISGARHRSGTKGVTIERVYEMVIEHEQLERSDWTQYIPPKGDFEGFRDDEHYREKLREWGLSSAKEAKREFLYKERGFQRIVTIKGYEVYGNTAEYNTLVIEFQDGNLSCIHPAYLKEMQQASFGRESMIEIEQNDPVLPVVDLETAAPAKPEKANKTAKPKAVKEPKPKKEKPVDLVLPAEKVHFTANVKQFALTYNPFNEENDEVVVLENVKLIQEPPIEVGLAWCSHSKTLKKYELAAGNLLEFDGKITKKKLAKGKDVSDEFIVNSPVLYKVNNPSKITKK